MNDNYFFDGAAGALTGKVPVQVQFEGNGDFSKIRGRASQILHAFLDEVRLGGLSQLTRTAEFPGGSIWMRHMFGVTKVILRAGGTTSDLTKFFGGILIRPQVVWSGPVTPEASAYMSLRGYLPRKAVEAITLSERAGVPGTGRQSAEWLIVQIHPTKDLADEPLKKGAVKIFRIKDPKFGDCVELSTEARYLVSTQTGQEFYLCGQKLVHVPPMPELLLGYDNPAQLTSTASLLPYTRMWTSGFRPRDFKSAGLAEGVIVVAAGSKLWALDTLSRTSTQPASWVLLAQADAGYLINAYGAEIVETDADQVRTVTCSGTNGWGQCSGFTVRLRRTASGLQLEGELAVVPRASDLRAWPGNYEVQHYETGTYSRSYNVQRAPIHVDAWNFKVLQYASPAALPARPALPALGYPDPTPEGTAYVYRPKGYVDIQKHVAYQALGFDDTSTLVGVQDELRRPINTVDIFGRSMARRPPAREEVTIFWERRALFGGYHFRLKGFVPNPTTDATTGFDIANIPIDYTPPSYDSSLFFATHTDAVNYYNAQGPSKFDDVVESDPTTIYDWYRYTREFSGKFTEWNWGLGNQDFPAGPNIEAGRGYAEYFPAYCTYGFINTADGPVFRWRFDGTKLASYDPDRRLYPFYRQDFYVNTPDFTVDNWEWDSESIGAYPKRAAVFSVYERWRTHRTLSGGLYGDFQVRAEYVREGQFVANEYQTETLETNIDSFPTIIPPSVSQIEDSGEPPQSGSYTEDEFSSRRYLAVDYLAMQISASIEGELMTTWERGGAAPPVTVERFGCGATADLVITTLATWLAIRVWNADTVVFEDADIQQKIGPYRKRTRNGVPSEDASPLVSGYTNGSGGTAVNRSVGLPRMSYNDPNIDGTYQISTDESVAGVPYDVLIAYPFGRFGGANTQSAVASGALPRPFLKVGYWGRRNTPDDFDAPFPTLLFEERVLPRWNGVDSDNRSGPFSTDPSDLSSDADVLPSYAAGFFVSPKKPDDRVVPPGGGRLYRDPRTGGFITEVYTAYSGVLDVAQFPEFFDVVKHTLIGNASGVVPFLPILQQWLSVEGLALPEEQVFITARPRTVAAEPTNSPFRDRLVALL
jgi:hypothetical protein